MKAGSGDGVFVLGTGRCGSTLLSNALRLHPEVLSLSEWFTVLGGVRAFAAPELSGAELWRLLSRVDADLAAHLRFEHVAELLWQPGPSDRPDALPAPLLLVPLPHLCAEPDALLSWVEAEVSGYPRADLGVQFMRLFERLGAHLDKRVWVERSGGSLEYAECFRRHFPRARYVCVLRDGCATALSMAEHVFFRVWLARVLRRDPELEVSACLEHPIALDRFGAYWSALMAKAKRFTSKLMAGQMYVMTYEDLLSAPAPQLGALAHFLGVAPSADWIARACALVRPASSRLDRLDVEQRSRLERACRPGRHAVEELQRHSAAASEP